MEQQGFLLIADITGYTSYLSRSELEHAQETLTDLLELLIEHTRPPLTVSKLEGDAVVSYALTDAFRSGQTLLEEIEETYVDFRRAIELMVLNNSCQCAACANVSSLDLKFFLHHATFALQQVGAHEEMIGSDVNFVHRLLKNNVTAKTGIRAYMLCTEQAISALGLEGIQDTAVRHTENVADFGEVTVWVRDMQPLYEARARTDSVGLEDSETIGLYSTEIRLPPALVWDYLNQSEFRNVLVGSDRWEVTDRRKGRIDTGSTYQCFHGKKALTQVVMEWRPFERVVMQQLLPLPGKPAFIVMEFRLEPSEGGTRLTQAVGRPTASAWKRGIIKMMLRMMRSRGLQDAERFRDAVEADALERGWDRDRSHSQEGLLEQVGERRSASGGSTR